MLVVEYLESEDISSEQEKCVDQYCHGILKGLQIISIPSMELKEAVAVLNHFAAPSLAETWDNVGLLVQPYTQRSAQVKSISNGRRST